jgi:hypothetical protein
MDDPTRIRDNVTVEITRGRMTRAEAIRRILDAGIIASLHPHAQHQNRAEEALQRLGISPGSIQKAKDLP